VIGVKATMLRTTQTIATGIFSRIILRNLLLLIAFGVFLLALNSATLAEDYYYVQFLECSPGGCYQSSWDWGASVTGDAHCYLHTPEGSLPDSQIFLQAWVWYSCDWDGWTYNQAEVDSFNDEGAVLAEARATYFWHECVDDSEWEYCDPNRGGSSNYEEPGCPIW
jgi:hypothetical protein